MRILALCAVAQIAAESLEPFAHVLTAAECVIAADVRGTINDACTITDMTRTEQIVVYRQMLEDLDAVNAIRKARGLDDLEPPT